MPARPGRSLAALAAAAVAAVAALPAPTHDSAAVPALPDAPAATTPDGNLGAVAILDIDAATEADDLTLRREQARAVVDEHRRDRRLASRASRDARTPRSLDNDDPARDITEVSRQVSADDEAAELDRIAAAIEEERRAEDEAARQAEEEARRAEEEAARQAEQEAEDAAQQAVAEPEPQPQSHSGLSGAAAAVAACESGARQSNGTAALGTHNWNAQNPTSSASGAFQFIDSTWRTVAAQIGASQYPRASSAPPAVQTAAFEHLWAGGAGAHHWNPSRSCWGPMLGI